METRTELPPPRKKDIPRKMAVELAKLPAGVWGQWLVPQTREGVYKATNNINSDRIKALPAKKFEARSYEGATWVRQRVDGDLVDDLLLEEEEPEEPREPQIPITDYDEGDKVSDLRGVITVRGRVPTTYGLSLLTTVKLDDGAGTVSFFGNGKTLQGRHEGEHVVIESARVKEHGSWQDEPQTRLSYVRLA